MGGNDRWDYSGTSLAPPPPGSPGSGHVEETSLGTIVEDGRHDDRGADGRHDESQSSDAHSIIDPAFTNGHERGQLTPSANKTAQWGAMTVLVILQEIH